MASYNVEKQNIFVKGEKGFPLQATCFPVGDPWKGHWRNGNQPLAL